jgi:hypothetical protein
MDIRADRNADCIATYLQNGFYCAAAGRNRPGLCAVTDFLFQVNPRLLSSGANVAFACLQLYLNFSRVICNTWSLSLSPADAYFVNDYAAIAGRSGEAGMQFCDIQLNQTFKKMENINASMYRANHDSSTPGQHDISLTKHVRESIPFDPGAAGRTPPISPH